MSASASLLALYSYALLRQRDRDLVEVHGILEDQLVERGLAERRLGRRRAFGVRVGPSAVEAGEVTGPQEIAKPDFRDAAEAALLFDLEGEKDLPPDEFARALAELDIGFEHTGRAAEFVFAVHAPEQKRDPPDARLFEHEADAGVAIADAGQHDGAHQFRHEPHREIGDRHQRLIARFEAGRADADLARAAARIGVQIDRDAGLRRGGPDRFPHLVHDRLGRADPIEDHAGRQPEFRDPQQFRNRLFGRLARQRQQHDEAAVRLVVELARPVIDGANAGGAQFRVLDLRNLLVGAVDELGIDAVAVHVLATVFRIDGAKHDGFRLLVETGARVAIDPAAADTAPAH